MGGDDKHHYVSAGSSSSNTNCQADGKRCSWSGAQKGCKADQLDMPEAQVCGRCNNETFHHICALGNVHDPEDKLDVH